MLTLPQIGKNELSLITCPAYIVAGEYDIMWLTDTVFIHENISDRFMDYLKECVLEERLQELFRLEKIYKAT